MSNFRKIEFSDTPNFDAFGRLRTSGVTSQIDLKQILDNLPLFINQVQNGDATSVHSVTDASTTLTTTTSGDYAISQSKQRFAYQTGKSQQIFMTFSQFQPQTNIIKRIGYYTSSIEAPYTANFDGLLMESSEGTVYACIYKSGSITSKVAQADWNVDKFNGAGPSGVTVDWTKSQILMLDFEWLGVGRVRWAMVTDGKVYPFHYSNHANNLPQVYMSNPNNSLRWELRQTGAGAGVFEYICATVGSEGAINELGKIVSVNDNGTVIAINNQTTRYAGVGVRLKADSISSFIDIVALNLFQTTQNGVVMWEIVLNPTVAGTFTYVPLTNSAMEYVIGTTANTVTGGTIIDSGYVTARGSDRFELKNALRIGSTIAGVRDQLVIVIKSVSGNVTVFRSISWREQI